MSGQAGPAPRVSLLMPNRDNAATLPLVLDRLARNTTYEHVELIVVDDGSTDASRAILRAERATGRWRDMTLIEREHAGVVETLNAGLRAAGGDVVVQLDADASVETEGWLERMLAFLGSDERVGVVSPKVVMDSGLVHAYGVNLVGAAGMYDRGSDPYEPPGRRTLHSRVRRHPERRGDLGARAAEVDAGIGCCMMYRRDDALAVGGYDRGFEPVWFDDLDLCLAIRRLGRKAFFVPDVRVIHHLALRASGGPPPARLARVLGAARVRAGALVPERARLPLARRLGLDRPSPEHRARLQHHYAYWRRKWGWDPLNPDLEAISAQHRESEVAWSLEPERVAVGARIAEAWNSR